MKITEIPISFHGIYFFGAGARVRAQIERELFIVFYVPARKACGLLFFDTQNRVGDLPAMLDSLLDKVTHASQDIRPKIHFKCFGAAGYQPFAIRALKRWLELNDIPVVASDLGKQVSRNLTIDCEKGTVGVAYAESFAPHTEQQNLAVER